MKENTSKLLVYTVFAGFLAPVWAYNFYACKNWNMSHLKNISDN